MQQVADGGQRQCLWASAQPVEVRHMSTELLSCAGLVRDPAFGFKMELLTQRQAGVATMIDLTEFRRECFHYMLGSRLLGNFSW